jgi:hypothetical protein
MPRCCGAFLLSISGYEDLNNILKRDSYFINSGEARKANAKTLYRILESVVTQRKGKHC